MEFCEVGSDATEVWRSSEREKQNAADSNAVRQGRTTSDVVKKLKQLCTQTRN